MQMIIEHKLHTNPGIRLLTKIAQTVMIKLEMIVPKQLRNCETKEISKNLDNIITFTIMISNLINDLVIYNASKLELTEIIKAGIRTAR